MTIEGKIIKHTILSIVAYMIAYTLSTGIILSIIQGSSLFDAIPMLFQAFPSLFTGNLLPSFIGYGAIYLCNKIIDDELVIMRSRFFTILAIIAIETIGTVVYYIYFGKFPSASFAIIAFLIIAIVKTNKLYKELINNPEVVETMVYDENGRVYYEETTNERWKQ